MNAALRKLWQRACCTVHTRTVARSKRCRLKDSVGAEPYRLKYRCTNTALLDKPTVAHQVTKFPASFAIQRQLSLSCQSSYSEPPESDPHLPTVFS